MFFRHNQADKLAIFAHLQKCESNFLPPLSTRVALDRYAEKLAYGADRFEAWTERELVGLVAAYCNRPDEGIAFVSNLSVLPAYRGSGISDELMLRCFAHAAAAGFERVELRVNAGNAPALRFYTRLGFRRRGAEGEDIILDRSMSFDRETSKG